MTILVLVLFVVFSDFLPDNLLLLYRRLDWPGHIPRMNLKREVAVGLGVALLLVIEWVGFEALTGDSSRLSRFDRALFLAHMLLAAGWIGYLVSLMGQGAYEEEPSASRYPSRG
ncbi:MAG: hypothetical protein AUJ06_01200 [Chloroflexi bacterium 13_1_40CM_3_70_6]|nr:MAG: hypothetical protein AUJ06_01200 [Chloroflexi bacterium 13_1_40CM_3_70_6]